MVFIPDFDNGTKNIILHLHKVSICCAGEQGNSISKEIKEMPQVLNKYLTVYFFHYAHLKKNILVPCLQMTEFRYEETDFFIKKKENNFFFFTWHKLDKKHVSRFGSGVLRVRS